MAVITGRHIYVNTFDKTYNIDKSKIFSYFESEFEKWDWLQSVRSPEAEEYYFSHIQEAKETLINTDPDIKAQSQVSIKNYVAADGDTGKFIFETKHEHGDLVAFYALQIATSSPNDASPYFNKSDTLKKTTSYEYHLANYLFFQHINAAEYITGNLQKKLKQELNDFKTHASDSLEHIERSKSSAHSILMATTKEHDRAKSLHKKNQRTRFRRYRKVFASVRRDAAEAKEAAQTDLKTAYDTYHAQVDLKSSIVYWGEKIAQHNKAKWRWLGAVVVSLILTFTMPVVYYAMGGVSALSAWRHENMSASLKTPTAADELIAEIQNKEKEGSTATNSMDKVVFASGIADLTGAALIVALLSVLLRLSLRQYNISIYLSHDAEERVTMLKTYLALSNEGKLSNDGDMKLVLETLFRASQTSGVPDSAPATPIELIIKAITDKK